MPWLLEILGPQHAGKTTIADLIALTLEENAIPALRLETDNYVYNLFPTYVKLRATDQREKARKLLSERGPLINEILTDTTRKAIRNGYIVIYDHVSTTLYKRGVARRIAKQTGAEYLSILITAPLDALKERWQQSDITDVKIEQLEKTYAHFKSLREEFGFNLTIDTSSMTAEEAAQMIVHRIDPGLHLQVTAPTAPRDNKPQEQTFANPKICSGDLQIMKVKDSYVIVHNHSRYITDSKGLIILSLCNGKKSIEEIAKIAGTDLATTRNTLNFLRTTGITKAPSALENLRAPIQVHPIYGARNRRRLK